MFPPPHIPTGAFTLPLHPFRLKKDKQIKTTHRQGSPVKNKHLKPAKIWNREEKLSIFSGGKFKVVAPELRHTISSNLLYTCYFPESKN